MKFLSFLNTIAESVFKRPSTYTARRTYESPITRGHVENAIENCIFCGLCVRKCPADAIVVSKPEMTWTIDRFRCVVCNACVEVCPKKCLTMDTEPSKPAVKQEPHIYVGVRDA